MNQPLYKPNERDSLRENSWSVPTILGVDIVRLLACIAAKKRE